MRRVAAAALASLALGACLPDRSRPAPPTASPDAALLPAPVSPPSGSMPVPRVAVMVLENHEYDQVIGDPQAPFLNALAGRSVLLESAFAITHPSLPNYLALLGGSTFGIDSDCTGCSVRGASLVDQMEEAGISWRAYMEGMPSACFTGSAAGAYAKKHDPFMYFDRITRSPRRCGKVVPFGRLETDLAEGTLPAFTWVSPDLCHDVHDCSLAEGDAWLSRWVPRVIGGLGPGGVLVLTFDEGRSDSGCCREAAGGHVLTILAGPGALQGVRLAGPADHYSLLRLIEDRWGLPRLGQAACPCTPAIAGWEG